MKSERTRKHTSDLKQGHPAHGGGIDISEYLERPAIEGRVSAQLQRARCPQTQGPRLHGERGSRGPGSGDIEDSARLEKRGRRAKGAVGTGNQHTLIDADGSLQSAIALERERPCSQLGQ